MDAKSIYDSMHGASGPLEITEKRTAIEMVGIQQSFNAEDIILRWVHSDSNLADTLTKDSAEEPLRIFHLWKRRFVAISKGTSLDDLQRLVPADPVWSYCATCLRRWPRHSRNNCLWCPGKYMCRYCYIEHVLVCPNKPQTAALVARTEMTLGSGPADAQVGWPPRR